MFENWVTASSWGSMTHSPVYRFHPKVECYIEHPRIKWGNRVDISPQDELRFDNPYSPGAWLCVEKAMRDNGILASSILPYIPDKR